MIKENYRQVMENIRKAEQESPFHQEVKLVAVSKTHPVSKILEVYEEGQRDFGENKVQELLEKQKELPDDIRWHMIGHLQTNKVRSLIDKVYMIHSVDSVKLARVIDLEAGKHGIVMPVLIEVNVGDEESKSGFAVSEVISAIREMSVLEHIRIQGLMCIPPAVTDMEKVRHYFRLLRNLSIDITKRNIDNIVMNILSMGMSDDYQAAIFEGSNIVRVGTGIFGMRDYNIKL